VCRLRRLLAGLIPGGMRRELTASKAQALLARIRPADEVAVVRLHIARGHLAGIRAPGARGKYLAGQIAALAAESGTALMTLVRIGPLIAGRILAEAGDVARFAARDKFASCNGTAPAGVSCGGQVRHRLSRAELPRAAHDGRHPDPLPRHRRVPLLRAQAHGRKDAQRSAALPQAAAVRRGLAPARP
jgi:transposase